MVNCTNCGFDVVESKFCPNCGREVKSLDEVNLCSNCSADVGESNFCPECGTRVAVKEDTLCSNCGTDMGNSNFCPNCGQPAQKTETPLFCPSCGKEINSDSKFCPHCGFSKSSDDANDEQNIVDNLIDLDDKFSSKMGGLFGKSKTMNAVLDKTSSIGYNRAIDNPISGANRKYYEKIEPVFLEVLESITDNLVIAVLVHKRSMMGSGGSVIGAVASQVYTPTKGMPHDEAVKYYRDMANEIFAEINDEKRKGTFDGEEFYKKKVKEHSFDNSSFLGISKSIKAYRKNQK